MTILGIDIDLTTDYLEEHWADEVECESTHPVSVCSSEVTHRASLTCRGKEYNACTAAAVYILTRKGFCAFCKNPTVECWSVRPV